MYWLLNRKKFSSNSDSIHTLGSLAYLKSQKIVTVKPRTLSNVEMALRVTPGILLGGLIVGFGILIIGLSLNPPGLTLLLFGLISCAVLAASVLLTRYLVHSSKQMDMEDVKNRRRQVTPVDDNSQAELSNPLAQGEESDSYRTM